MGPPQGLRRARRASPALALALAPLALLAFYAWLRLSHGVPKAYIWQQADLAARLGSPAELARSVFGGGLISVHYLALFAAPLLPALAFDAAPRRHRLAAWAAAALAVGGGTIAFWRDGLRMPYLLLGPLHRLFEPLRGVLGSAALDYGLTVVSAVLAVMLLAELASRACAAYADAARPSASAATPPASASSATCFRFSPS